MERHEHVMMGRELEGKKGRLTDFQDAQIANYQECCGLGVGSKDILWCRSQRVRLRVAGESELDHHV